MLALQTRRRLRSSASHFSVGITTCLSGAGGGAGACTGKGCCRGFGLGAGEGVVGEKSRLDPLYLLQGVSVRSMLVRAAMH